MTHVSTNKCIYKSRLHICDHITHHVIYIYHIIYYVCSYLHIYIYRECMSTCLSVSSMFTYMIIYVTMCIYIYVKIYGSIYLVPDLQNTASCITIYLLDKGNPMGLASITAFFYKPLALNWLCNSWHFLRQAQHLPMQAQCQHPSQFFNSQNHPKSTIDFIVTLGEKLGKHRGKSRLFRHHSFFFTSPWSIQGTSCQARSKRWSKKSLRSKEPLHRPGKTVRKQ